MNKDQILEEIEGLLIVGEIGKDSQVWFENEKDVFPVVSMEIDEDNDLIINVEDYEQGANTTSFHNNFDKMTSERGVNEVYVYVKEEDEFYQIDEVFGDDDNDLILLSKEGEV